MITNKENYIQEAMDKLNYKLVEEFMNEYKLSELDARRGLAEIYYHNEFEIVLFLPKERWRWIIRIG